MTEKQPAPLSPAVHTKRPEELHQDGRANNTDHSDKKASKNPADDGQWQKRLYETIIYSSNDFIYVFDTDYRLTFVNDALLKKWDRTLEELVGKRLQDVGYKPWQAKQHEKEIKRVISTKQPVRGELLYNQSETEQGVYPYFYVPVLDGDGEVEAVAGTIRDIAGYTQSESSLRESERKYKTLFESVDEGFCIIEVLFDEKDQPVDYRFLETNPSFEKQTGLKNADGKCMRELAPEHEEHWFKIFGNVALTGKPIRFENSSEAVNRWYNAYAFRFGNPDEKKIAVIFKDITERKKNEHSNAFLSAIIEDSDDAIISKDLKGIITSWNPGAERLFGYTALEAIGRPVTILMPSDRIDEADNIMEQLKQGKRLDPFETIRLHKNGNPLDVSLTVSPIKNSKGQVIGASKIARDITLQKQAEENLQTLNETLEERVKKRTAALMSYQEQLRSLVSQLSKTEELERQRLATDLHDNLGQTLAIGKMKLDQLKKSPIPPKTASNITGVAALLDEAIRYTRALMSDLKPPPSLNKGSLKEVIAWVSGKMEKYDLKVVIEDDEQPKPLDEEVLTTLRQCVRELLFNVVKHAKVKQARIILGRENNQIRVTVTDNGNGFNPDDKNPAPDLEKGFGLFNVFERMDLLGGSFEINSKPGKGTKAVLLAPVKGKKTDYPVPDEPVLLQGQENNSPAVPSAHKQRNTKIRVLLADDHKMMREGLRKIIKEEEDLLIIAEASDGREAVNMAREFSPDVVVMDVNMPIMNGIEATRRISEDNSDICIIGLSLHDSKNVSKAMKNAGASAYLTKTEAIEALCETIRRETANPAK